MASNEYRAVELKRFAKTSSDTAEARAWRSFKSSILPHGTHAIHSLSFAPFSPFHLAVPNGMRVTMYDTSSHSSSSSGQPAFTVHKNISRFHHPVSATAYRRDASLLACASSEGKIQVFDLSSRIVLRTFRGHNTDVKCVFFTHDMESVVSCSDDHTARVWDIPGNTQRGIFKGHTDYVRCGLELQGRANTLVTGSYDHTVKLWDMRTQQCTLTLDHGEPVMAVVAAASGSLVYSAGGNYIRVWDILSGGKCVAVLNNHSQEITSLCINEKTNRLFSASLDQHVKVYDLSTYEVTHTMKYNKAILSVAMNEAATMFAVGMVDGNVVIRKSKQQSKADEGPSFDEVAAMMTKRKPRTGTKRYFNRGVGYKGEQDDFKVDAQRKQRLMKYDKLLKNFEYHKALDQALSQQHAVTTASVLEELNCRDGLRIALSNRSPKSLEPLLRFINKCITNPHYSTFVIQLTEMVLDMYKDTIGASVVTDELFIDLQRRVNAEMTLEKQMQQMRGGLDMLLAANRPQGQQNDNKRRRLTEN